jgi:hypothetical protein
MALHGYLAHENPPFRKTSQQPYAQGPVVILGGWVLLMSEVPPYVGGQAFSFAPMHQSTKAPFELGSFVNTTCRADGMLGL